MSVLTVAQPAVRGIAATMLLIEIVIHAALAPAHLSEVPYIGWSFVIASVLLTVALVAVVATPSSSLGWRLGSVICVGMAVAFLVSRVFGLPGYHEEWSSDSGLGLISLPPEVLFVICAMRVPSPRVATFASSGRL